jgi:hypothetical protein
VDRRAGDTRKAEYALLKLDEAFGLLGSCEAGVREAEDDNAMPHQRSALNIAIPDALVFGEHGETMLTYVAQPVFIGNALSRMLAEHIGKRGDIPTRRAKCLWDRAGSKIAVEEKVRRQDGDWL